jgi:GDP-D-mannose dehydratase
MRPGTCGSPSWQRHCRYAAYVDADLSVTTINKALADGAGHTFEGHGADEVGIVTNVEGDRALAVSRGQVILRVDPRYFRPTEVANLLGDSANARQKLR